MTFYLTARGLVPVPPTTRRPQLLVATNACKKQCSEQKIAPLPHEIMVFEKRGFWDGPVAFKNGRFAWEGCKKVKLVRNRLQRFIEAFFQGLELNVYTPKQERTERGRAAEADPPK